jgi:hypothetical protein
MIDNKFVPAVCTLSMVQDLEFTLFCSNLFGHYQNGFLAFSGSLMEQPNWYYELIGVMSHNKAIIESDKQKNQQSIQEQRSKRAR